MKTIMILLFILLPIWVYSQNSEDKSKFQDLFEVETHNHDWGVQLTDNKNEVSFIFSALFVTYKEVFSSQDVDMCVFTPSCSVYAIESIKQKGIIAGYFNAIDRLTRCNPGGNKNLTIDITTGKYYDPLE